jgi:multiple sugar transport system substrate-binding protein
MTRAWRCRRLWASLAVVLLALGACRPPPREPVSFMVFGDPAERQAYADLVAAFHEAHPEIIITLRHIPSPEAYRTRLATDFAAGAPPDVFLLNYRRYAAFAAAGQLQSLEPYLAASDVIDAAAFYQSAITAFRWQGELLCLPQNVSSLVVYYNIDLFRAAGVPLPAADWTWDDFVVAARTLTQDHDGDGVVDQYGLGVEPSLYRLAPFVWMNGGPLVDDEAQPTRLALTRPPSLEALEWFVALRQEDRVAPGRAEEMAQDSESRFIAGTTAMYLNSRRGTPTYREMTTFSWDVAPLPRGQASASVLHSDGYCLASASEHKEAAWRLVEFANSPQGQAMLAASGRTVPSLRAVAESAAFLAPQLPPASSQVFLESAENARLVPVVSTWEEIERVASEEIARAFYGEVSAAEAASLAVERTREYFLLASCAR